MNVKLVWITPDAEQLMAYCARVSSPNQDNPEFEKLLRYCIINEHWSVFEMASMCVEITTSRAISAQILRHRSFSFQEFSQRYAAVTEFETYEARRQDTKNRQNSLDDMSEADKEWFRWAQATIQESSKDLYAQALERGIAKEQARFLLPMATRTKLYMSGSVRSWIHYCRLRGKSGTQKEHRDLVVGRDCCLDILTRECPTIGKLILEPNHGLEKYGTTCDRTDLHSLEWLQHLKEEAMDAIRYCEAMQRQIERTLEEPRGASARCHILPIEKGFSRCTREAGHSGPCAHSLELP